MHIYVKAGLELIKNKRKVIQLLGSEAKVYDIQNMCFFLYKDYLSKNNLM